MEESINLPVSYPDAYGVFFSYISLDSCNCTHDRLLTDRFAPASENAPCNTEDRRYCGGNYRSIIGKLDYIAGMGYDAIWISPTGQNMEGYTQYGEAFHASCQCITGTLIIGLLGD